MTLRRKVLGWTVLGFAAGLGLGLLLGWLLLRQDRRVPRSLRVPSPWTALADREAALFAIGWIHDPSMLLAGFPVEPPALGPVLGYLGRDAILFGLREPRLDRGWTAVALLRAPPAMAHALPWIRRYLPPTWQWRDRPADPGCSNAFEVADSTARLPWHLTGQLCGSYLVVGEADPTLGARMWRAFGGVLEEALPSVAGASPPAAVLWLRTDRLPETFPPILPAEVRSWVEAQDLAPPWVTLTFDKGPDGWEVRVTVPTASASGP
jgi:hypothetical protein